jgi:hypothetical protein
MSSPYTLSFFSLSVWGWANWEGKKKKRRRREAHIKITCEVI